MAKKKNKNNNQNSTNNNAVNPTNDSNSSENQGEKKGGDGGAKKKEINTTTVVLKLEMHCDGCISKIVKCVRSFHGVEEVRTEPSANKLTVIGFVDPVKIQEVLHKKFKKKVELISPQPKKEDGNKNNNDNKNNKKEHDKNNDKNQKPKEAPVMTAVLKLGLHCQGCIEKIHRTIRKTKGVHEMSIDKQKELVTVKGTMDVKALTEALKERLKRPVDIVPPKKEKDGSDEKGGAGGGGGGGGKKKGGSGGDGGKDNATGAGDGAVAKPEEIRTELMVQPGYVPGYGYVGHPMYVNDYVARPVYPSHGPDYGYGYGYGGYAAPVYPDHWTFNDENPNACSIM